MAKSEKTLALDEVRATALTAYLLSVSTLRLFLKRGILAQDEVELILTGVLSRLESSDLVSVPAAHGARSLLSALASDLGVPQKPMN
jgi:hypothetical protein